MMAASDLHRGLRRRRVLDGAFRETLARAPAGTRETRHHQPGAESAELRELGIACGLGLSAIGLLSVLAVIFVHQALALPLSELPARPGLWPGLLMAASGLALVRTSRCARHVSCKPELPARAAPGRNGHVGGQR